MQLWGCAVQFAVSEDELALKAVVERFVETRYGLAERRRYRKEAQGYSGENWQALAELGILGAAFSAKDGGLGCGPREMAAIFEALGAGLVVEPMLEEVILAGGLLARTDRASQKGRWLPAIIGGRAHLTLAHFEHRARFNLSDVRVRADLRDDGTFLTGEKLVVPLASAADAWIVSARDRGAPADPDGIAFYLVDPGAAGVARRDFRMADGSVASAVAFTDTPVVERLGIDFEGFLQCVDMTRFAACAEMIGIMSTLFDTTVEYLRNRKQFGAPLSSFQAIRFRLADQYMALEQSRSHLSRSALFMLNKAGGSEARRSVAGMKSYVSRAALELGEVCVHLHGAMGMTDDLAIGHGYKRLLMLSNLFGDPDSELMRFAQMRRSRVERR
jgi:alkylation response protein AidB-like acyl-CoA dehydrogenase